MADDARRKNPIDDCPMTAAMAAIGGKWKLTTLWWLNERPHQFAELRRKVFDVSAKVMTEQLRELEADGLVSRQETGPVPAPVIYSLTDYGRAVMPVVESLRRWGAGHVEKFGGEPLASPTRAVR